MGLSKTVYSALALSALAVFAPVRARAQDKPFYLHSGDTVVFYGDSITEQRFYTYWVEVYTATRFPKMPVEFFNAGIGGDRVTGGGGGPIDLRLSRDVFPHKPSVVTIMLGMNDGSYQPLTPQIESAYKLGYEHILASLHDNVPTARVTLLGPSPYDEVTRPEMFPGGYNSTLTHFADLDADLARAHGATFIDLNAPFVAALKRGAAVDPLATELLLPDRVHPEQTAHWFMAQAILKGWNAPALVSSTTLDAAQAAVVDLRNAHVTGLKADAASLSWAELEDALPLPLNLDSVSTRFLTQITDLVDQLDQEPLKVTGLTPGAYDLLIDGRSVGKFTDLEFAKGVNLALLNTPMRGQAFTVSWNIRDRDDTHYVRLMMLVNEMKFGVPHQRGEEELTGFEQVQQNVIYDLAQPKSHTFKIAPIPASNAAGETTK